MGKLNAALADLEHRLSIDKLRLANARRRYRKQLRKEQAAYESAVEFQEKADDERRTYEYYGTSRQVAAEKYDRKALKALRRKKVHHDKRVYLRGLIKKRVQQVHEIETSVEKVEAELDAWKKKHKVTISGNRATGGNPHKRWMAVCLASVANCARGIRRNFYSMSGALDLHHVIKPGEEYGERSDCSSTVDAWAWSARLDDPTGTNWGANGPVYTGTLGNAAGRWKQVSLQEMINKGWGYIVYGSGGGHHTEAYTPSESDVMRTSGHGSAPVDFGTVHLFGSGEVERYFVYA